MEINIENLMKTAIAEMNNGQHDEARKHFDLVVIHDSENIEAPFFRAYCNCYCGTVSNLVNDANNFTNAFCRYVDNVKALNNPEAEKEKLNAAYVLLSQVCSMFQANAQKFFMSKVGIEIGRANAEMHKNCSNKLKSVNADLLPGNLKVMNDNEKVLGSNNKIMVALAIGLGIAVALYTIGMIIYFML